MKKLIIIITIMCALKISAQNTAPEWSKSATIYEVNIRQYTPEGTFDAFTQHIPRLEDLGVGILWIMPVQPIGKENRKGSLGSYYSIADYTETNPEFGSMKDFKRLVDQAHKHHMHVILDWVGNHTSFDHVWMKKSKDYYTTDAEGKVIPPVADWSDVADLNYDNPEMRKAMIEAMKYWITEADVDGFRCDVAMMIPDDFWKECFAELRKIKPDIFLLSEAEGKQFHEDGFNMDYSWVLHKAMNEVAQGKVKPAVLDSIIQSDLKNYAPEDYRMRFTSNHDENSWNGSEFERMGDGAQTFAVLAATVPGMPLIYSGQEVALNKRLRFFDKDTIQWERNSDYTTFYTVLTQLKKDHPALWNANYGGSYRKVETGNENVYGFVREKDGDKIIVLLNLHNHDEKIVLENEDGRYEEAFTDKKINMKGKYAVEMRPWGYAVLVM